MASRDTSEAVVRILRVRAAAPVGAVLAVHDVSAPDAVELAVLDVRLVGGLAVGLECLDNVVAVVACSFERTKVSAVPGAREPEGGKVSGGEWR